MVLTKLANGTKCLVYLNPRKDYLNPTSESFHQMSEWVVIARESLSLINSNHNTRGSTLRCLTSPLSSELTKLTEDKPSHHYIMCASKINKSEQINKGRKAIQNSKEN